MNRIVVLISGRGSNMEALIQARDEGRLPVELAAVISNRPDAGGLARAAAAGIPTEVLDHRAFAGRVEFDRALAEAIEAYRPDWVVLAGFMRILSEGFVERFAGRLINIHPSLLPAFPGLHTHRQALAAGVKAHGCTVHFVTPALDHGPIIAQAVVPVRQNDDEHDLAARVLMVEHLVYPRALRWLIEGRARLVEGRVRFALAEDASASLIVPTEE